MITLHLNGEKKTKRISHLTSAFFLAFASYDEDEETQLHLHKLAISIICFRNNIDVNYSLDIVSLLLCGQSR